MTEKINMSKSVAVGLFFFRHRVLLYVPFTAAIFFIKWHKSENLILNGIIGAALIILGSALRFWAVRCCGKRTTYKREEGKWLTTHGPYSYTRNPLYHSNLLIGCALIMFSGLPWLIPIFVVAGYIYYHYVVLFEESRLAPQFGTPYEEFRRNVPRWLFRLTPYRPAGEIKINPWKEVYMAERLRLLAVLIIIALIYAVGFLTK